MKTNALLLLVIVAMAAASWASPAAATGKVYRWVDEDGVVHFGDAIPPEYSKEQHEILGSRGSRTTVHGEPAKTEAPRHSDRDRALMTTFGSVEEIEAVRDRRTGFLESQNDVALGRLHDLRARKQELAGNPAAINELSTVEQRIREYEHEIDRRNAEIARIREQFDQDIARFRELQELLEPDEAAAGLDPAAER